MKCEVKLGTCIICFKKQFKKYTRKPTGRTRNNWAQYLEESDRFCSSRREFNENEKQLFGLWWHTVKNVGNA
jgi:hypothetical protein